MMSLTIAKEVSLDSIRAGKPNDDAILKRDIPLALAVTATGKIDTRKTSDARIVLILGYVCAATHPTESFDLGHARLETGAACLATITGGELHGLNISDLMPASMGENHATMTLDTAEWKMLMHPCCAPLAQVIPKRCHCQTSPTTTVRCAGTLPNTVLSTDRNGRWRYGLLQERSMNLDQRKGVPFAIHKKSPPKISDVFTIKKLTRGDAFEG
jgi:hypothetical protein